MTSSAASVDAQPTAETAVDDVDVASSHDDDDDVVSGDEAVAETSPIAAGVKQQVDHGPDVSV